MYRTMKVGMKGSTRSTFVKGHNLNYLPGRHNTQRRGQQRCLLLVDLRVRLGGSALLAIELVIWLRIIAVDRPKI